jgi:hypothetical protein
LGRKLLQTMDRNNHHWPRLRHMLTKLRTKAANKFESPCLRAGPRGAYLSKWSKLSPNDKQNSLVGHHTGNVSGFDISLLTLDGKNAETIGHGGVADRFGPAPPPFERLKNEFLFLKPGEEVTWRGSVDATAVQEASELSSDLHNLSYQLHPAKLDLQGLVAALGGLCRELSKQHGIKIEFVHRNVPGQIRKDVALCLFRIVQEALRNVVKHGKTSEAQVELFGHENGIDLCVSDSGAGFNPKSVEAKGGLGLTSMRERLRLIGGHLTLESEPLHGTRIRVRVPQSGFINVASATPD